MDEAGEVALAAKAAAKETGAATKAALNITQNAMAVQARMAAALNAAKLNEAGSRMGSCGSR
jgi:hypothetical protein